MEGSSTSSSSSTIRSWRTSFLTLRDEVQNSPTNNTLIDLLDRLIFTQSQTLISSVPNLPIHEVTSDVLFLLELARTISKGDKEDAVRRPLEEWWICFLGQLERDPSGTVSIIEATKSCLETVRSLADINQRTLTLSDNAKLLEFLLKTISFSQNVCSPESRKTLIQKTNVWEIQTTAFTMISELISRVGTSLPAKHWQSTLDAFRNIMDVLASKGPGIQNCKFWTHGWTIGEKVITNAVKIITSWLKGFTS